MSREFRWVSSTYFYDALLSASEDDGGHEVTKALTQLYGALVPVESACASFEAGDSGAYYPTIELQDQWMRIKAAVDQLAKIYGRDRELVAEVLRRRENKSRTCDPCDP